MSRQIRILMLEDNSADAELTEHHLRKAQIKFSLLHVRNEAEFTKALAEFVPTLILADYAIPGFSCPEALKLARKFNVDIPFLCVSGTVGEEKAVELMRLGATDYVNKRDLGKLLPAIERSLREADQRWQRHESENALRNSEFRFRAIFEGANAGIAVENLQGGIADTNRALQQMLGYTAEEFQQITRQDFTHGRDHEEDKAQYARLLAGKADYYQVEKRFVRKDGRIIWGRLTVSMVRDGSGQPQFPLVMIEDITERQLAEEVHLQHASIVEFTNDAIVSTTFDGVILGWNPAAERVYGYSEREVRGHSLSIIVPPEKEQESMRILEGIKSGDHIDNFETIRRRKDGSLIHVSVTISPIKDVSGKATGASSISRDITERKRAEEALRKSEANLARAQTIAHLGSWEWNILPSELSWSDETYRMFGLKREEVVCSNELFLSRVHPDDRDMVQRAVDESLLDGVPYSLDHRIILSNGEIRFVNEQAEVVFDENKKPLRMLGTVLDITDRKRAENLSAAFSKLGERLSSATTAAQAGRIIVDVADRVLGWDACAVDLCSADQKKITSVLGIDVIDGQREDVSRSYSNQPPSPILLRVMNNGAQLILRTLPIQSAPEFSRFGDRSRPSASLMYVPIRNGARLIGILSIQSYQPNAYTQQDLETLQALGDHCGGALERIRAETERQNLEVQLRQSQKMESVGQLAGGIAHDFNNILTVIQGHVSLLSMMGNLSETSQESANQIALAAERAANLTRQLLTFSRRQIMQPKNLDLNEVVNHMTKMLRRLLGEDVSLQVNYMSGLPMVHVDPGMMEQILLNLAVNARDAMPKGGQLLVTTALHVVDAINQEKNPNAVPGNYICLTVKDTGTGIPPEVLPHIFEPFFTTKDVGKGTGLGLATVYGIVQQHHGWIKAVSTVGEGTTFQIFLPTVADAVAVTEESQPAEDILRGGSETILVVEDEPPLRILVRSILEKYGYSVMEAVSGVAALDVWRNNRDKVDLLLTDMVMPQGLSGRELAKRLLEDKPNLKVIYSSGYSLAVVGKDMVLQEGINFLQKPYHPRKLAQAIRDCLDNNN